MVGSSLAPKWPMLIPFCVMNDNFFNFLLISDALSVGGCWGQPILLFFKLINEAQMGKPLEPTRHHNSRKLLILLSLRAIYLRSLHYETPCNNTKMIRYFLNIKISYTTGCHRKIPSVHSWHFLLHFNDFWNFRLWLDPKKAPPSKHSWNLIAILRLPVSLT